MLVTQRPTQQAAADPSGETRVAPLIQIVDDESTIQALLRRICEQAGYESACYGTAADFLSALRCDRAGCFVLDLNLPDASGIQILEQLGARGCNHPVILMSGMAKVSEAVAAFKLGSIDFLEKPFTVPAMLETLKRAVAKDTEWRAQHAGATDIALRFARLSPRETEVMELVVQGAPNKEIASRLGLSPKTVEVHRANVMKKSAAHSVAELVRMHVAHARRS